MARLANTIEAILYLKAQPLTIAKIAEYASCDLETAEAGLIELMGDYAHRDGALEIAEAENGYSLQLKLPYKPLLDQLIPLDIGLGALRTLAAIALRGPISQTDLVELRGSGAYQHIPELVEQGFVRKRRQSDGRSYWLQVTEKFYQRFEIDKLPQVKLPPRVTPPSDPEATENNDAAAEASPVTAALPEDLSESLEPAPPSSDTTDRSDEPSRLEVSGD
jgi:segregation and condensation protein B